jgi:hypothetical protein
MLHVFTGLIGLTTVIIFRCFPLGTFHQESKQFMAHTSQSELYTEHKAAATKEEGCETHSLVYHISPSIVELTNGAM